ncbi:MAG: hypothetical protein P1V29_10200 [Gammaproteobacteria bacterium]|nr:hypothetical protein [Gammaproteobacteria bacterium]
MYWNLAQRACAHPHRALVLPIALATVLATAPFAVIAQPRDATESIKFALFSAAWGENTDDGVRVVAQNQTEQAVTLERIRFLDLPEEGSHVDLALTLDLDSGKYAQTNLPPIDLLSGDDCVTRTMADNWKLVEISNYTLNPSVRNLIIEDTNSFRIYQCVRSVELVWRDASNAAVSAEGWVLYHFESRSNG